MKPRYNRQDPNVSPFLGILEGKKRRAEAEAAARIADAERKSFLLQLEAARQGYEPEKEAREQAIQLEDTKQGSEKTLYMVIGFIVVAVMVGLYFIKRK